MSRRELERLVGAVILPSVRPPGGLALGAPLRTPSDEYLQRFAPAGVIGFGRRLPDGRTIDGLAAALVELRARAPEPLFACADLEEGAGYHLPGQTSLPPARALAEAEAVRPGSLFEAGYATGLEARRCGIELVLAPVLDVNSAPDNPIIGARAFGCDVASVSASAEAFLAGLLAAGAGASLKHFPGHGDTSVDSHLELPRIERPLESLRALELAPFEALVGTPAAAGLGARLTVMLGHLDVPALTGAPGLATSLSPAAVACLRGLGPRGFGGAVLTDGLEMLAVAGEPELGVRALEAGCDGLLAPGDEQVLAGELLAAAEAGRLERGRLEQAAGRMRALAAALLGAPEPRGAAEVAPNLGRALARAALEAQPGWGHLRRALGLGSGGRPPFELRGSGAAAERLRLALGSAAPDADRRPGLLVSGPGEGVPKLDGVAGLVWLGTPESLPAWAQGLALLWAWAPGRAVEGALLELLGGGERPGEDPGTPA